MLYQEEEKQTEQGKENEVPVEISATLATYEFLTGEQMAKASQIRLAELKFLYFQQLGYGKCGHAALAI